MLSTLVRKRISQTVVRTFSDGPPPRLLRKYEHFQKDNGIPVYLKGGVMDKVLFGITLAGIAIGMADGLSTLFSMAFKKKK